MKEILIILCAICAVSNTICSDVLTINSYIRTNSLGNKENLARDKTVYFSIAPNVRSKKKSATTILTDGIKATNKFDGENILGWTHDAPSPHGAFITIDLGEVAPIKSVDISTIIDSKIRLSNNWQRITPEFISVSVSKTGEDFYLTKKMAKITAYGKEELPFQAQAFFVPNETHLAMRHCDFKLALDGVEARYVGIHLKGWSLLDEIEVIKAREPSIKQNSNIYQPNNVYPYYAGYGLAPANQIWFGPIKDKLVVPRYMKIPFLMRVFDYRGKDKAALQFQRATEMPSKYSDNFEFVMELPEGLELFESPLLKQNYFSKTKKDAKVIYNIKLDPAKNIISWGGKYPDGLHTRNGYFGPITLVASRDFDGSDNAVFYCLENGKLTGAKRHVKIITIEFPKISARFPFVNSLLWMEWEAIQNWPDFLKTYKELGFNTVPAFARTYFPLNDRSIKPEQQDFLKKARDADFMIAAIDSPLHLMPQPVETKCPNSINLCVSYVGELYKKEIVEIAKAVKKIDPDWLFFDLELYRYPYTYEIKCPCSIAAAKQSGQEMKQYITSCGTRIVSDLKQAIAEQGIKSKMGMYYVQHKWNPLLGILDVKQLYPKLVDVTMPEFYGSGNLEALHTMAQFEYQALKGNWQFINFLSTGTYGEFPSFKIEPMVLEEVLNGGGITWFAFRDFDTPEDYYYIVKALKLLEPHIELLNTGKPVKWEGNNKKLTYTMFKGEKQCLLLVGNYGYPEAEVFTLENLPFKGDIKILDLTNKSTPTSRNVSIMPQHAKLFFISE